MTLVHNDAVKVGELVLADILCPGCNCQLVVALIGLAAHSGTISDFRGDFWFSVKIRTSEKQFSASSVDSSHCDA